MVAYLRQMTKRISVRISLKEKKEEKKGKKREYRWERLKNLFWLWNRPSSSPLLLTALLNGYIDHDHHVDHDDTIMIKSKKYLEKCDHHDEEHDRKLSYSKGLNVACKSVMRYYVDGNIRNLVVEVQRVRGALKPDFWKNLGFFPNQFQFDPIPSLSPPNSLNFPTTRFLMFPSI